MRLRTIPVAAWLGWWAVSASAAEMTNLPGPPMPPHWYQQVNQRVTLHRLSPVEYFRGLLGMTPAQRERVLANKPPAERRAVLAKVAEYEAMPREIREARLHETELHWRLMTLMRLPPALRSAQLQQVSPLDQPMILATLRHWDDLPGNLRQALMEKQGYLLYYLQWQTQAGGRQPALENLSPSRQQRWLEELRRWQSLSEAQRARWSGEFGKFFAMNAAEQKDAIETLSDSERRQMEQTLRTFAQLPAGQRRVCILSFEKFATMPPEEQNQFLHNAQRWQSMSAQERELWRRLVNRLPPMPPMPPSSDAPGLPPMPPGMKVPATGGLQTNPLAQAAP